MIWDAFIANLGTVFGGIRRGSPGEVVEEVEGGDGRALALPVACVEPVAPQDGRPARTPGAHHAQTARAQRCRCPNNARVSNRHCAYMPPSDETNTHHTRALVPAPRSDTPRKRIAHNYQYYLNMCRHINIRLLPYGYKHFQIYIVCLINDE